MQPHYDLLCGVQSRSRIRHSDALGQQVVPFCRLISAEILRLIHPGARMVYVGKQAGLHTRTQEEIHALLCQFASEGHTVLRLKGGDPFIFGRGGEEAQYLQERGIAVYTVPGRQTAL